METAIYKTHLQLDKLDSSSTFLTDLGKKNIVALISPRRYEHRNFTGTLSIKTAFEGQEVYSVDKIDRKVTPINYLLLNSGVSYSNFVEHHGVNALTVFFAKGYVENILRSHTLQLDYLLENMYDERQGQLCLLQGLNVKSERISLLLNKIRNCITKPAGQSLYNLDELLFCIATEILIDQNKIITGQIQPLSAAKRITKIELYKRVSQARDYIDSSIDQDIDLKKLALISSLSKFHFLRVFKECYQLTPHQYLIEQRIKTARHLLRHSKLSTLEIAQKSGFNYVESFYRAFLQKEGVTPKTFRENSNFC